MSNQLTTIHRNELYRMASRLREMARLVPCDMESKDKTFAFVDHFVTAADEVEKAAREIAPGPSVYKTRGIRLAG